MRIYRSLLFFIFNSACILAAVYEVGPQKQYDSIGLVPWENLSPGDSVKIYYRTLPYKEKWVICRQGTQNNWIVIKGIPDASNRLPTIDGTDATTRSQLNFWSEERGVIKIGGANTPADCMPQYILVENLIIKSARPPNYFTGRNGRTAYLQNASAIFLEKGENIIVRNCTLYDCGNGFFSSHDSYNILVEGCYIYDNGIEQDIYEHNNYTESHGITFQYNHFWPLRLNCLGNNLKDRSSGCVIRYNWIESGNRQLDLVDADYADIYDSTSYRSTYVYGNIFIEPEGAGNSQICHYGGDSGNEIQYRKGTLYFYNNTVISTRTGHTTLFRLSSESESCDSRNNIIYTSAAGSNLAIIDNTGKVDLYSNWFKTGWVKSHSNTSAKVNNITGNINGNEPGFTDTSKQDFSLLSGSICINNSGPFSSSVLPLNAVTREYKKHQSSIERLIIAAIDIGAYEYKDQGYIIPANYFYNEFYNIQNIENNVVISYSLPYPFTINFSVIDLEGRLIISPAKKVLNSGKNKISFKLNNFSSGIYFIKLNTKNRNYTKKFAVIR